MQARINLFFAWFLIPHALVMDSIALFGHGVLNLLGVATQEGDIPGRLVGGVVLLAAVFLVQYFRGSLPPEGKPEGNGYRLGHRLVLAGNLLAATLFVFMFIHPLIANPDVLMVLSRFSIVFNYMAIPCWAVGFSLLYQSSLPER